MYQRHDLFDLMINSVSKLAHDKSERIHRAFGIWFANMYFAGVTNIEVFDDTKDGKADLVVTCQKGRSVTYKIINSKFTQSYDKSSPVSFYDEIVRLSDAFRNKSNRQEYLEHSVRADLRDKFNALFSLYDDGDAELLFITNHRVNKDQYEAVKEHNVRMLHLDEMLQYLVDHLEDAMPETEGLLLSDIALVLSPPTDELEVPTSIVFARLVDFLKYMKSDPLDYLFARNIRLWLGDTETNKGIYQTFKNHPKEFAFSNNGITILCKSQSFDPAKKELLLENPRVVNGSQTLHSIRAVVSPSSNARVMVRIIQIPMPANNDLPSMREKRKDIIHKISIISNMQNPIKRWNLVANDDFQNELARYFREKRIFYERRKKEWQYRKSVLQPLGISQGPTIPLLAQYIASYHYQNKLLGPGNAQGKLDSLFDEETYKTIRETSPELAYQIFLLYKILDYYMKYWRRERQYIANMTTYVDFCLFSFFCYISRDFNMDWGSEELTKILEKELLPDTSSRGKEWKDLVRGCFDYIIKYFKSTAIEYEEEKSKKLTVANFFKNPTYTSTIFTSCPPNRLINIAKKIFSHD